MSNSRTIHLCGLTAYERGYRRLVHSHLQAARIVVQQTDLSIHTTDLVTGAAKEAVIEERAYLEAYLDLHPGFLTTLSPWPDDPLAPPIVHTMILAAQAAGVGPMAAVAGALAEQVGQRLLQSTSEVIVENGGDIFIGAHQILTVGVYAGASQLSLKLGLRIDPATGIRGICTSSGTVGHSLSFGQADAVCVLGDSCALADAAATAIGNRVHKPGDIQSAIQWGRAIRGVRGILIIVGDKMGAWGELEIVALGDPAREKRVVF